MYTPQNLFRSFFPLTRNAVAVMGPSLCDSFRLVMKVGRACESV